MAKQFFKNWTNFEIKTWADNLLKIINSKNNLAFVENYFNLPFAQKQAFSLKNNDEALKTLINLLNVPAFETILRQNLSENAEIFNFVKKRLANELSDAWYSYTTQIAAKTNLVWTVKNDDVNFIVPTLANIFEKTNRLYFVVATNWVQAKETATIKNNAYPKLALDLKTDYLPLANNYLVWANENTKNAQILTNLTKSLPKQFQTLDQALLKNEAELKNPYAQNLVNPVYLDGGVAAKDLVVYDENTNWDNVALETYLTLLNAQFNDYDKNFARKLLRFVSKKASLELSRDNNLQQFINVLSRYILDKQTSNLWAETAAGKEIVDKCEADHLAQIQRFKNEKLMQDLSALGLDVKYENAHIKVLPTKENRAIYLVETKLLLNYAQLYTKDDYFRIANGEKIIKLNNAQSVILDNKYLLTVLNLTNKWQRQKAEQLDNLKFVEKVDKELDVNALIEKKQKITL